MNPTIIGISGGSGSGKTTSAIVLQQKIKSPSFILSQDRYYYDRSHLFDHDGGMINFDHPSSIEFSLMATQLTQLKQGQNIAAPSYDFVTHQRRKETDQIAPYEFIIVDGILIFSQPPIRAILDYRFYVDADEENRFMRRISRDTKERGRTKKGVLDQINRQVKPMHDQFVEPSKKYAHIVIQNNHEPAQLENQLDQIINQYHW